MSTNTAENNAVAAIAYAFPWPGWVMSNNWQIKHPGRNRRNG
jgi:hypothetical protein